MEDTDWRPSKCPECGAWREAARNPVCESCAENQTPDEEDTRMSETDQKQAPERIPHCTGCGEYPGDGVAEVEALAKQRDELREQYKRASEIIKRLQSKRDQALAASAAREIAIRDRAADMVDRRNSILEVGTELSSRIRALPLSPDGQQALDDMLAEEWDFGYQACDRDNHSETITPNPHRKPSDAGKSEDRG